MAEKDNKTDNKTKRVVTLRKSVLGLIILILLVISLGWCINNHLHPLTEEEGIEQMDYANKKIREISESSKYKESSIEERKEQMEPVLTELKQKRYIKNLEYYDDNYLFSFQYSNGSLGGVYIKSYEGEHGDDGDYLLTN